MSEQSKKELTERDICTKYITPALASSGWDIQSQIREEVSFTAGRIFVHGTKVKRGDAQRADYVLYYKPNMPIAGQSQSPWAVATSTVPTNGTVQVKLVSVKVKPMRSADA